MIFSLVTLGILGEIRVGHCTSKLWNVNMSIKLLSALLVSLLTVSGCARYVLVCLYVCS